MGNGWRILSQGVVARLWSAEVWISDNVAVGLSPAHMTGNLVGVGTTPFLDGLACRNDTESELRVLMGVYSALVAPDSMLIPPDTVTVWLKNLRDIEGLVVNDVVNAKVHWIPGGDSANVAEPWISPIEVFDERRLVFGDSLEIEVIGVGVSDAISIEVTPIAPTTVPAPGED